MEEVAQATGEVTEGVDPDPTQDIAALIAEDPLHAETSHQCTPPVGNACWVCGATALPDKLACRRCVKEPDAIALFGVSTKAPHPLIPVHQGSKNSCLTLEGWKHQQDSIFRYLVKEAINWEEPKETQQKQRKYSQISRVPEAFPFDELDELIKEEWQNPEKKTSLTDLPNCTRSRSPRCPL